jgi:hypothetical protein
MRLPTEGGWTMNGTKYVVRFLRPPSFAKGVVALALSSLWFSSGEVCAATSDTASLQAIIKSWRDRESSWQSAQFAWTETRIRSRSNLGRGERLIEPATGECGVDASLILNGAQVRFEYRKAFWPVEAPDGLNRYVGAFDGVSSTCYFPPGYTTSYPTGYASHKAHSEELASIFLKPLLFSCRPLFPRVLPVDATQFVLTSVTGAVNGHDCVILAHNLSPTQTASLWVVPSMDYSIVRESISSGDTVISQVDVNYERHPASGLWIPHGWRISVNELDGTPYLAAEGTLGSFLVNPELKAENFAFAFPVGTWVHDGRNNQYILGEGGTRRLVPLSDRKRSYEELIQRAGIGSNRGRVWLLRMNLIVVIVVSVVVLLWRWRGRLAA